MAPVTDTGLDFTKAVAIATRAAQITPGRASTFDHSYVLNSGGGKLALVARLTDPKSGRSMEVKTDQPGLQLYTGQRVALALETQHFPDAVHHPNFPNTILKPGETFKSTTIYAFSAK
jgi:aldose 1-epimerase